MGPIELLDYVGLDTSKFIMDGVYVYAQTSCFVDTCTTQFDCGYFCIACIGIFVNTWKQWPLWPSSEWFSGFTDVLWLFLHLQLSRYTSAGWIVLPIICNQTWSSVIILSGYIIEGMITDDMMLEVDLRLNGLAYSALMYISHPNVC